MIDNNLVNRDVTEAVFALRNGNILTKSERKFVADLIVWLNLERINRLESDMRRTNEKS